MENSYRLVIACPDTVGIVAAVSGFVAERGGWLLEASYHADETTGWFFMRNEIRADSLTVDRQTFCDDFQQLADRYRMQWSLSESGQRKKMVIMASLASHCLADLLHRWHSGDLYCDIVAVIANHDNLRSMAEWYGVDFYHVDMQDKLVGNGRIETLLAQLQADVVVLARYMQIIPPALCQQYQGRMINIHHSFLPSFIGANPYQKAYERGVKLIGATCHYVTENLDEGPIIEQDVIRVNHRHNKDDMVRLGKDVETGVLARGVRYHLEDRVLVQGNKTVILD
ncbi:MAG TPA: formyltetrahydrofolate deformylase [Pseudomonadales bacterium]